MDLIPYKLIIDIVDGEYSKGLLLYRTKTNGRIDHRQRSITIDNMEFSKPNLATILTTVIDATETQERADAELHR